MKTITTGTKITFTETNDKFELTQTPTGFDVKPIKFSKNIPTEPYTFQDLLDEYDKGKITIHGFEETDGALVKSIFTNYIHTTEIEALKADITRITGEKEALEAEKQQLITENTSLKAESLELKTTNHELITAKEELTNENKNLTTANENLRDINKELTAANKDLTSKNEKLNAALADMPE